MLSRAVHAPPDHILHRLLDQAVLKAKRKWVGDQLRELENLRLLKREDRPGRHLRIIVLRDDGSGRPFDDPDGSPNNTYVTILGGIIASGALAEWTTAQIACYLFAMIASATTAATALVRPNRAADRGSGP